MNIDMLIASNAYSILLFFGVYLYLAMGLCLAGGAYIFGAYLSCSFFVILLGGGAGEGVVLVPF